MRNFLSLPPDFGAHDVPSIRILCTDKDFKHIVLSRPPDASSSRNVPGFVQPGIIRHARGKYYDSFANYCTVFVMAISMVLRIGLSRVSCFELGY